jgi:predicted adenylyl cyclase CyaB
LKAVCGERVVVKKERQLWRYKHTRIHLDKVKKLGNFLELETVMKNLSEAKAAGECSEVIDLLNLDRYKKLKFSYSELLLKKK